MLNHPFCHEPQMPSFRPPYVDDTFLAPTFVDDLHFKFWKLIALYPRVRITFRSWASYDYSFIDTALPLCGWDASILYGWTPGALVLFCASLRTLIGLLRCSRSRFDASKALKWYKREHHPTISNLFSFCWCPSVADFILFSVSYAIALS